MLETVADPRRQWKTIGKSFPFFGLEQFLVCTWKAHTLRQSCPNFRFEMIFPQLCRLQKENAFSQLFLMMVFSHFSSLSLSVSLGKLFSVDKA